MVGFDVDLLIVVFPVLPLVVLQVDLLCLDIIDFIVFGITVAHNSSVSSVDNNSKS